MIEEKLETPKKAVRPEIAGTTEMVKKTVIRKTLGQPVTHMTTEKEITVNPTERMISMKIEVTEEAMDEKMLPDLKHEVRAEMTPEVIPEMIAMAGQEYVLLTLLKKVAFFHSSFLYLQQYLGVINGKPVCVHIYFTHFIIVVFSL